MLSYVLTFNRIMFGSLDLNLDLNFVWLITTLAGFSIYNCCFYYSHRNLFRSMELRTQCSANYVQQAGAGLEPREMKLTGSPGTSKFLALSIIYSNIVTSVGMLFCPIKHGGPQTWSTPNGRWKGRFLVYKLYMWVLRVSHKLCLLGKKVMKILHSTLLPYKAQIGYGWCWDE